MYMTGPAQKSHGILVNGPVDGAPPSKTLHAEVPDLYRSSSVVVVMASANSNRSNLQLTASRSSKEHHSQGRPLRYNLNLGMITAGYSVRRAEVLHSGSLPGLTAALTGPLLLYGAMDRST